jgi:hypothetical protein
MVTGPPERMKPKGNNPICSIDLLALIILVILSSIFAYTAATTENYGSDTSTYFELAKSIKNEHKYWFNFEPHTVYPPGFPLLLAGLMKLVGESFAELVKVTVAIGFLGIIGIYLLLRIERGPPTALAVATLVSTSFVYYFWTTVGLSSDVPYFTVSIYAILFFEIGSRTERRWISVASSLLAALLISYLVLIRSIGITFVFGIILWFINPLRIASKNTGTSSFERIKKWFPTVLLPIAVFLAWSCWCNQNRTPVQGGDYMDSYSKQILKEDPHQIDSPNITLWKIPARIVAMGVVRTTSAMQTLFNSPYRTLGWSNPGFWLFLVIIIAGFCVSLREGGNITDWYFFSYIGMLLLYPFHEGTRYIFPIQPFLYVYGIIGMKVLFDNAQAVKIRKYYPILFITCSFFILNLVFSIYLQGKIIKTDLISIVSWSILLVYTIYLYSRKQERFEETERNKFTLSGRTLDNNTILSTAKLLLFIGIIIAGIYHIRILAKQNMNPDPKTFINYSTVHAGRWISDHTPENSVIMHDQYQILHRLTKRKTIRFPLTTDPVKLIDKIHAHNVTFLIVLDEIEYEYYNPSTMRRFEMLMERYPKMFNKVYSFDQGKIYSVNF